MKIVDQESIELLEQVDELLHKLGYTRKFGMGVMGIFNEFGTGCYLNGSLSMIHAYLEGVKSVTYIEEANDDE